MDDFKLSRDPSMMKAWKERLEPNMEKYKEITGLGMKIPNQLMSCYFILPFLISEKAEMKLFELPNTALYMNDKPAM